MIFVSAMREVFPWFSCFFLLFGGVFFESCFCSVEVMLLFWWGIGDLESLGG